jgi:methylmalonyl-CoA mutase N-terminal domain/subunit
VDETLQRARAEKLRALKARRDEQSTGRALASVEEAARGDANLMPRILDAVESSATLGEIADVLRKVYGVHQETFAF